MSGPAAPVASPPAGQPAGLAFDAAMESEIAAILARYPRPGAGLLPVLWLCQRRWGWISPAAMSAVAARLGLAPAFVEGVVSFYTMFQRRPPGRFLLQVCTTLSCQLCGTGELVAHLKRRLGVDFGGTSADGAFTLVEVQCLGACGEGPVIQVNDDYYGDLTVERLDAILDRLAAS
ncbi:MAG: NAD(P)H-dependent oxidoreductase subunit E [Thermoanaerobaculales bacterium]|jgi:NADH-quinone oxidoreductase subunit E|nr:NAD(P)H-dependent oxidoreductase subunit E [Thermoanaerobaculales bacterium]